MLPKSEPHTIKELIFDGNQDPDHPAIETPGYQPLTYRDLRNQVLWVIKTLHAMGFGRNDRIAVIMPAGPETAVLGIAVMTAFTHTPLNPQFKEHEFLDNLLRLKVKAVIVQQNHETAARAAALSQGIPLIEITPSPDKAGMFTIEGIIPDEGIELVFAQAEDTAIIMQTSGTTSLPKIVPLIQKQVCRAILVLASWSNHTDHDKSLHIVPHFHLLGVIGTLLAPLSCGGTVICTRDFIAPDFFSLLKSSRPTFYCAGPAHHQAIFHELKKVPPQELKNHSLRYIRSVSAPMPASVRQELETLLGIPVINSYAMTESPNITFNNPIKEGSVGFPIIESLAIMDDNGTRLKTFEPGEVAIQGEVVFSGYEDAPDKNASAFINGWFMTGDVGYLDDEGYLYLTGRKKEQINKGGEKISPVEIDQVLMTHPDVHQAMAFRIHDDVLGEDIAAMVVLEHQQTTEEDLRRYLLDHVIAFKVPRRIFVVDEIPIGQTGKPRRFIGTERYHAGTFEDTRTCGKTSVQDSLEKSLNQEKLTRIWKEILDIESLSPDDDFFRCGGNSLTAIELLVKIQRSFHLTIEPDTIYRYPTIRQQVLIIAQKTGNREHYHPLIVPIRGDGTLPPLFCIHPLGGWIGKYQEISPFLTIDRPVFGLRAQGFEATEKPSMTIQEAVLEYADAIKTVQKKGPYHLMGYSAGAIYAFELACLLQNRGEQVNFLGIIDQSVPSPQKQLFHRAKGQGSTSVAAAGYHLYCFLRNRLKTNPGSISYSLFVHVAGIVSRGILVLPSFPNHPVSKADDELVFGGEKDTLLSQFPAAQHSLVITQIRALQYYHPTTYSGNLTFFSTGPDTEFYPGNLTRGWNSCVTGKITVIDIPGKHDSLFKEPFVGVVAKKIEESLKRVDTHG